MKKTGRQSLILERVSSDEHFNVASAAAELNVSEETIRRDIKDLERKGLVQRRHGGATLPNPLAETTFHERLRVNTEGKRRIGEGVAELISDGDTLLIETGTTNTFVAQALRERKALTVITNSVDVARSLAFQKENDVYMAGGKLTADDGASLGQTAIEYITRFRVSFAVLSAAGLDPQDCVTAHRVAEAEFSRAVMSRAEKVVLVADQTKFNKRALVSVCDFTQVDILVTDAMPPPDLHNALERAKTELIIC